MNAMNTESYREREGKLIGYFEYIFSMTSRHMRILLLKMIYVNKKPFDQTDDFWSSTKRLTSDKNTWKPFGII